MIRTHLRKYLNILIFQTTNMRTNVNIWYYHLITLISCSYNLNHRTNDFHFQRIPWIWNIKRQWKTTSRNDFWVETFGYSVTFIKNSILEWVSCVFCKILINYLKIKCKKNNLFCFIILSFTPVLTTKQNVLNVFLLILIFEWTK